MTRTFGAMSTVKLRAAGVGSRFPAGSVARTSTVWEPPSRDEVAIGELHDASWLESRRHSKLDPGSEEEKEGDGEASLVGPEGPELIVVSGPAASAVAAITRPQPKRAASDRNSQTGLRRCGLEGGGS